MPLPAAAPLVAALLIPVAYVALLYAPAFHAKGMPRDHPATIIKRFASTGLSSLLAVALFLVATPVSRGTAAATPAPPLRLLGLNPPRPLAAFIAPPLLALLPYLPTGCARLLLDRRREQGDRRQRRSRRRSPLVLLRDCLVAPLTEELAFRACLLPLLAPAIGADVAPWVAPLFFSLAHAHHHVVPLASSSAAANKKKKSETDSAKRAPPSSSSSSSPSLAPLLLQLSYTYAFGLYASLMLVATGSLPGVVVAHALCNALGLPGVGGGGPGLLGATAAATAAMVAAMAAPKGALDAARWFGGGLFAAP